MKKLHLSVTCIIISLIFQACYNAKSYLTSQAYLEVKYAKEINIDGVMNETAWENVTTYDLEPEVPNDWGADIVKLNGMDKNVIEKTKVKFLYNDTWLYIGIKAFDSDLICQSPKDQGPLFYQGDSVEIFLHRKNALDYWEIYGDISNKKTAYHFPGRGLLRMQSNNEKAADIVVATTLNGTLNMCKDRDNGWTMEIAIPLKKLAEDGLQFNDAAGWTVCIVRLNYGRYLPIYERTMIPRISTGQVHIYEEYMSMKIVK